jgi:hypothetical protein
MLLALKILTGYFENELIEYKLFAAPRCNRDKESEFWIYSASMDRDNLPLSPRLT